MKFYLIEDAGKLWHRFWSTRLILLSAALSATEFALPWIPADLVDHIGKGYFSGVAFLVSLAAGYARIVQQRKVHEPIGS